MEIKSLSVEQIIYWRNLAQKEIKKAEEEEMAFLKKKQFNELNGPSSATKKKKFANQIVSFMKEKFSDYSLKILDWRTASNQNLAEEIQ